MAVLYSLYYAIVRRSPLWWHGITFVAVYMVFLVWQTYYALATIRNTSWGTRDSTHTEGELGEVEVVGTMREEPAT
jgi:hyaluronan synthase